jgi:hypothetical protein
MFSTPTMGAEGLTFAAVTIITIRASFNQNLFVLVVEIPVPGR